MQLLLAATAAANLLGEGLDNCLEGLDKVLVLDLVHPASQPPFSLPRTHGTLVSWCQGMDREEERRRPEEAAEGESAHREDRLEQLLDRWPDVICDASNVGNRDV